MNSRKCKTGTIEISGSWSQLLDLKERESFFSTNYSKFSIGKIILQNPTLFKGISMILYSLEVKNLILDFMLWSLVSLLWPFISIGEVLLDSLTADTMKLKFKIHKFTWRMWQFKSRPKDMMKQMEENGIFKGWSNTFSQNMVIQVLTHAFSRFKRSSSKLLRPYKR